MANAMDTRSDAGFGVRRVRRSAIGDLVRIGAATQTVGKRILPTPALGELLPGTRYSRAAAEEQRTRRALDIARENLVAFVEEARADPELSRLATEQGIDVDAWADEIEGETIDD